MSTITIEDGFLYVTDVPDPDTNISDTSNTFDDTVDGTTYTVVKIAITRKTDYDFSNNGLTYISIPDINTGTSESKFIDTKDYKRTVTCMGELWSKDKDGNNESDTALEKMDNLRTLAKTKDTVTFVWGTYNATKSNRQKFSGTIGKMLITEPYGDKRARHHTWSSGVVVPHRIEVQIQLVLGDSLL